MQPPFLLIALFHLKLYIFLGKFSKPIVCLSQWWVLTSQLVPLSQQDYLPESLHHCEKKRGSQSGPLQLAQCCQGFTFLLKSYNEQSLEEEVNKAVMHIDSNTIQYHCSFFPKVRIAELTWHMMFFPLQLNTYQLQSFKVSYHFVSTMTAYVSKKHGNCILPQLTRFFIFMITSLPFFILPAGKGWHTCQENILQLGPAV